MPRLLLALLFPLLALAVNPCDYAADHATYVRERLGPDTPPERLRELYLRTAHAGNCRTADAADLWLLRKLIAERLGVKEERTERMVEQLRAAIRMRQNDPFQRVQRPVVSKIVRQKWALVIGINEFKADPAQVPPLRFPAKDASDFAAALTDPNVGRFPSSHVHIVTNEKATAVGIKSEIGWLRKMAQPEDLVLIYISSHGSPRKMDDQGMSYIILHDSDVSSSTQLYATSYQMVDLVADISREIKAQRLVLILDTCHAGGATAEDGLGRAKSLTAEAPAEAFSAAFRLTEMGAGRVIIASSTADQRSWESPSLDNGKGNGYFTHHFLRVLRETAGRKDLKTIFPMIQSQVQSAVAQDPSARQAQERQTPMMNATESGDEIILGVEPMPVASAKSAAPTLQAWRGRTRLVPASTSQRSR